MTSNQANIKNRPVHVLQVASGDLWAGAEAMLYVLAKALHTELNVQVTVILFNHGKLEQKLSNCGISVHILDESYYNSIQLLQQLEKVVTNTRPDVIHTHGIKENILGSITAWRNHIPSIRTSHGAPEHQPPLYNLPKRLIRFLDRLLGSYCQQHIIAVSLDLATKLECNFPRPKISVIENGIDIDSLTAYISQRPASANIKYSYHVGLACRLVPVKRVDLFIDTAIYLKQHHPELSIQFHIYGDGPLQDSLTTRVQSIQTDNYIYFEGHCDNIAQKLLTLDALLMTSDHEGLPMVLLEAMCLQIPIIAHAVGGIPNLLNYGKCGTLISNHTAEAFAEAILNRVKQPEKHLKLAAKAYERIKNNYSASHNASAYLDVYKRIAH